MNFQRKSDNITVKQNKKFYETIILKKISETDDDIYISVGKGDRLDLLAKKYYGDDKLWWIIAINNDIEKPSVIIEKEQIIRIPKLN